MRWSTVATIGTVTIAALVTACTAATAAPDATARQMADAQPTSTVPTASSASCYSFAVSALRHHLVVRRRPPACAGLPQSQINQDVARAIRTVVGPHPKALARQLSAAESRYLASLVRSVRPPSAVKFVAVSAPTSAGELALRFTALTTWVAAALAGAYLLVGLLGIARRRQFRKPMPLPVVPLLHAGLATAGLLIWIAFMVAQVTALAWADVGLTWVIAGLGIATLLGGPGPEASSGPNLAAPRRPPGETAAAFPSRAPVVVIAIHGALATLTILLVLLAAVANG